MIPWLPDNDDDFPFPGVDRALYEPDGLLAAGGSLRPKRLLTAYLNGIFPWYNTGEPILWWSPSRRSVIFPDQIHISKSMRRVLNKNIFTITKNKAFKHVISCCSKPRYNQSGTWITQDMIDAYYQFYLKGYAHSLECWHNNKIVGGLYGVHIGRIFFGESMYSAEKNASKVALITLAQQPDIELIDCQIHSQHLESLGAKLLERQSFLELLAQLL